MRRIYCELEERSINEKGAKMKKSKMVRFGEACAAWFYGIVVLSPVLLFVVPIVALVGVIVIAVAERALS